MGFNIKKGSFTERMVKYRGCYMSVEGVSSKEKDVVTYEAYNFDNNKMITQGKNPEFPVVSWSIYNARKSDLDTSILKDVEGEVQNFLSLTPLNGSKIGYIKVNISYTGIFIFCSINHPDYTNAIFAIKDGRLLYTAVYYACARGKTGTSSLKFMEVGGEHAYEVYSPATYRSRAGFNVSFFNMYVMKLEKGFESNIVPLSIRLYNTGIYEIEFPVSELVDEKSVLAFRDNYYVLCRNLLEDLPKYFEVVMTSEYYDVMLEEAKNSNLTGYGINLEKYKVWKTNIDYSKLVQFTALESVQAKLGYNVYVPISDSECVYVAPDKRTIQRAYIKEVCSISGDVLFYTVVGCAVTFRSKNMLNKVDEVFAGSKSRDYLSKAIQSGTLPKGKFLSLKGILLKGIEDVDDCVTLKCSYLGKEFEVVYSRSCGVTSCTGFPNIQGLDCSRFMRNVMKFIGYSNYKSNSVYYRVFVSGKYVGDCSTMLESMEEHIDKRGVLEVVRCRVLDGRELAKFKCIKPQRLFEKVG